METVQAILIVLGIYVAAPVVIGLAIGGTVVLWTHLAKGMEQPKALAEAEEVAQHAFKA